MYRLCEHLKVALSGKKLERQRHRAAMLIAARTMTTMDDMKGKKKNNIPQKIQHMDKQGRYPSFEKMIDLRKRWASATHFGSASKAAVTTENATDCPG